MKGTVMDVRLREVLVLPQPSVHDDVRLDDLVSVQAPAFLKLANEAEREVARYIEVCQTRFVKSIYGITKRLISDNVPVDTSHEYVDAYLRYAQTISKRMGQFSRDELVHHMTSLVDICVDAAATVSVHNQIPMFKLNRGEHLHLGNWLLGEQHKIDRVREAIAGVRQKPCLDTVADLQEMLSDLS